jgi:hypothetical protein
VAFTRRILSDARDIFDIYCVLILDHQPDAGMRYAQNQAVKFLMCVKKFEIAQEAQHQMAGLKRYVKSGETQPCCHVTVSSITASFVSKIIIFLNVTLHIII